MRVAALLCAALLLVAGCGGQSAPGTAASPTASTSAGTDAATTTPASTASPTGTADVDDAGAIPVTGGSYPGNATLVFQRVEALMDENVSPPGIVVEFAEDGETNILSNARTPFRTALGIVPAPNRSGGNLTAYTPAHGYTVHLYESVLENETAAEATFAHESVHVVQFKSKWGSTMWGKQKRLSGRMTHDGRQAYYFVLEGSATYVQDRYQREYLPETKPAMERYEEASRNASPLARLSLARYHLGSEYVASRADSPEDLEWVHYQPPVSTEQALHRNHDPIKPLNVDADGGDQWRVGGRDRMGELFLRVALATELNRSAAVAGADGWGDDRRIRYGDPDTDAAANAWVLRWDDEANATEFERTFRRYLGEKATKENGVWVADEGDATYRVDRVSADTVVVLLGNESFVRGTNVSVDSTDVVVVTQP